ncbi:MAG: hypothetical protein KGY66_02305 [Candidatus Thermoplasmatota archaeon]|nr:hypothetical protein [Candidatus Thermoplasmatota archaeon]MBS3789728.1 hypothetical protein [Candidatus Thermoplasmatota archaeon]
MAFRSAEEIVKDDRKGAAKLLRDALESLRKLEKDEIESYLKTLVKKRYSMTPLVNLANQIFLSLEQGEEIDSILEDVEKDLLSRSQEASVEMRKLIKSKDHAEILTLSYSSTVIQTLSTVEKVTVLESRPKKEGKITAKKLSDEEIEVEYWIDAGMCKALERVDCAVVGADTISKKGFLNKIGTRPLAIISESLEKEFYVAADSSKILPSEIPPPKGETHPTEEVWDNQDDIIVRNDYFEQTQLKRAEFVTENGHIKAEDIRDIAEEKEVSKRLLRIHPLIKER